jgi:hypothetical protein
VATTDGIWLDLLRCASQHAGDGNITRAWLSAPNTQVRWASLGSGLPLFLVSVHVDLSLG